MNTAAEISNHYRLIRAFFAGLGNLRGSYAHRSAASWRELAATAEALARECRALADLKERS